MEGPLLTGSVAQTWDQLAAYTGAQAVQALVGEDRQQVFEVNAAQMRANYDGGVDFQLRETCVLLCAQTASFLYDKFTPRQTRYAAGSRPVLETVVKEQLDGTTDPRDRMLALMRFCRDLYQRNPERNITDADYIFGGREEELIAKGEELCECLGRLFVALCEIAAIPARYVIHIGGGHIVAEALVDGHWAYVDPRTGVHFERGDGVLASTWDLWSDPGLLRKQPDRIKTEISPRWTWEERVWRCEQIFFRPQEITGFTNYSLMDADRYQYAQVTQKEATQLGLWSHAEEYQKLTARIFGLAGDGWRLDWSARELGSSELIYRNDGFSQFYYHPAPMSPAQMAAEFIDPLAGTNVDILEWGMGPGSVFCYDTQVGQVFGEDLTEDQRAMLREGDINVWRNVMGMIREGTDPLRSAIDRGHQQDLKMYTRLEMNHEYGPADDDNWEWVGFVGDFNKQNPQFRLPGSVRLDFKHPEVRAFKLDILREAAERGSDGISMDFAVYPPFFETPDPEIMTDFVGEARAMADQVGTAQERYIELMVRFPAQAANQLGIDWKRWMQEHLVDAVVPAYHLGRMEFDLDLDEFVSMGHRTGVKVYGCIFQSLGFHDTDATPDDEKIGPKYDKAKTIEVFYAQAMLFHRAGVDGIQLAMAEGEWNRRPFFDDLADPERMLYAPKRYMVNQGPDPTRVLEFCPDQQSAQVDLRLADDTATAQAADHAPQVRLMLYLDRHLSEREKVTVQINGRSTMVVTRQDLSWDRPVPDRHDHFDPDWWRVGEYTVSIDPLSVNLGVNRLELHYDNAADGEQETLSIRWIDVGVSY
jgi:hypothetical protein